MSGPAGGPPAGSGRLGAGPDAALGHAGFVPGRHLIDAYGRGGFRFAGMSHRGSILILPSGIRAWNVTDARELTSSDLTPVLQAAGEIDVLILGTGTQIVLIAEPLRSRFREVGVSLDAMQTGPAARTYNVLVAENRKVAAALIAVA